MQQTTAFAIRGLLKVLREEGLLDDRQMGRVIEELAAADAEAERKRQVTPNERFYLRTLCMEVANDAGIHSPFKHGVPGHDN